MASPALQLAASTPVIASRARQVESSLSRDKGFSRSVSGSAFARGRAQAVGTESRTEDSAAQLWRLSAAAPVRHRRSRRSLAVQASAAETQCWRDQPDGAEEPGAPTSIPASDLPDSNRVPVAQSASSLSQPYGVPQKGNDPEQWDVVGLGQAMVDFSAMISDEFLDSLKLPRGQRVVVDHEERGHVLRALDGCAYKLTAGGSLSNTLVALARLGSAGAVSQPYSPDSLTSQEQALAAEPGVEAGEGKAAAVTVVPVDHLSGVPAASEVAAVEKSGQVHVAMVGSVGSDPLGDFYRTKLLRANVHFLSPPIPAGTTGTVIVLTTPDAQRTMLSYQGMSSHVTCDPAMIAAVEKSRVLVVEGYLWELPQTVDAIAEACAVARSKGLLVALTASDATCVLRHRPKFWSVLCRSAHILFTNVCEARALAGCSEATSPAALARHLSKFCPLVAVTDGEKGSYLGLRGEVVHIPAMPCTPRDTCGAGDAYAAGVLYALLKGAPTMESIGSIAARVSAVVVSQQGTRLREEDAEELAGALDFPVRSLAEGQVFHTMMGLQPVQAPLPAEAEVVNSAL